MAQHYNICGLDIKYCQQIESAIRKKFNSGINKVRTSIKYIEENCKNAKEHDNDIVFYTQRLVCKEKEILEIHFDEKRQVVTKIYIVK